MYKPTWAGRKREGAEQRQRVGRGDQLASFPPTPPSFGSLSLPGLSSCDNQFYSRVGASDATLQKMTVNV